MKLLRSQVRCASIEKLRDTESRERVNICLVRGDFIHVLSFMILTFDILGRR